MQRTFSMYPIVIAVFTLLVCIGTAQADLQHGAILPGELTVWKLNNTNAPLVETQIIAAFPDPTVTGPLTQKLAVGDFIGGFRETASSEAYYGSAFLKPVSQNALAGYGIGPLLLFGHFMTRDPALYGCGPASQEPRGFLHDITFLDQNGVEKVFGTLIDCTPSGGGVDFRFNPDNGLQPPYTEGRFPLTPITLQEAVDELS